MDDKPNQKSKISALLRLRAQEASIPITQFSQDLKSSSPPQGFKKDSSFSSSDSSSSSSSQSSPQNSPKNSNAVTLQPPNKTSANNSARSSDNVSAASNHFPQPSSANQAKPKSPMSSDFNARNVLNTPNFLKEYHYRRKSGNSNNTTTLVKEGPNNEVKEIHQMTQFANIAGSTFRSVKSSARSSSSQDTAGNKNQLELKAEKMDSQGGATSFAMSDISGDDEVEEKTLERKHLRNILKRSLRVAYFIGILYSMKNRVKIYGALRPIDQVKEFDSSHKDSKRKSLLPILPTDTFMVVWTIFLTVLLVMTAILTPYAVSFVDDGDNTFDIIDWIFNVGFGIDIIITFLSAYHDPSVGLVTNFKAIALNYVKLWFWIDVLAILPFDDIINAITDNGGSANRVNKLLRLLRFPRLYRLLKVLRLFKMLKLFTAMQSVNKIVKKLNLNIGMIRILKVMVNILFLNHCVGCIWFFLARVEDFDPDTWVVRCGLIDKNSWNQYVASYYWSFQTLTTVGYGDIPPKTLLERIFANIWMVIGVGFYSFTIGNLSTILANIDRKGAILKTKITAFNNFAIKVKLPEFLRQKIQRFFELNHKENVYYWMDPQESLKELPANLKTSLLLYSYYGMIKNIRLLQLDANFTASILTHLKLLKLKKGETLYRQDDPAEEVFFISKGSVKLVNEFGHIIYSFTEGTYFGEVETIEDDKRISFCQATENTILLLCGRDHFLEALQDFPTIEMQIKRTIQSRKYKFSDKMKQLQGRVETEDDQEKANKKKMMNSTEYFNKVVVKSFTKDKPAPAKRRTVPPKMPSRNDTEVSRNASSTLQALMRGNSSVFTKRDVGTSQEDTSTKISPFKAIRKALDTVNEEKGSATSLRKRTISDERPTPQLGAVKRPLTKMNIEALQGMKSPKEEERRLLDEPSSKMEQVSLFQNNPQQGDHEDLLELDATPMSKLRQQRKEDTPMTFGPFGTSGLINSQTSLVRNERCEDSSTTDIPQSKSDIGLEGSPNHDAMSMSMSSSHSGGGGFRRLITLTSQNNNWVVPENGENYKRSVNVSPLNLLRVPGIPDGESVIQEEDSEIEGSATISRANSGIVFEDFDLQKSTKKIVNVNSSELSKSKQFGNLVKILSEIRQKSDPNDPASRRSKGSRVFNLEGEDDSNIRPSIADDDFE